MRCSTTNIESQVRVRFRADPRSSPGLPRPEVGRDGGRRRPRAHRPRLSDAGIQGD